MHLKLCQILLAVGSIFIRTLQFSVLYVSAGLLSQIVVALLGIHGLNNLLGKCRLVGYLSFMLKIG